MCSSKARDRPEFNITIAEDKMVAGNKYHVLMSNELFMKSPRGNVESTETKHAEKNRKELVSFGINLYRARQEPPPYLPARL